MLLTLIFALFYLWAALFFVRTIACLSLRPFGLWHPRFYALFPRLPWRNLQTIRANVSAWWEMNFRNGRRQTAGWLSTMTTLTLMYYPARFFVGRMRLWLFPWLQPIGLDAEAHITIFAQSGAGKSNVLKTWLGLADPRRAIIATDPKGDAYARIGRRMRQRGRNVVAIDLEGKYGGTGGYNVFDDMQKLHEAYGSQAVTIFCDQLAESLVQRHPGEKPFFPEAARSLLASLICLVYVAMDPPRRNLATVYRLIMFGWGAKASSEPLIDEKGKPIDIDAFTALWLVMDTYSSAESALNEFISKGGGVMLRGEGRNSVADVLFTLSTAVKWLAHETIQKVVSTSSFTYFDLKGGRNDAIFLMAGAQAMGGSLAGFVRMFFEAGLYVYETRQDVVLKHKTLYLLDEGANIGTIPTIAKAGPLLRGSGVQLVMVAQDIPLLQACYPDHYKNFIGNSSFTLWLTVNEETTLGRLMRILGEATRTIRIKQGGETRIQQDERPIATADQLQRMLNPKRGMMIVTRSSARPILLRRPDYFRELPFWLFEPDPDHPEPFLRRIARECFEERFDPAPVPQAAAAPLALPAPLKSTPTQEA